MYAKENLHDFDQASFFITMQQLNIPVNIRRYAEIGVADGNSTIAIMKQYPDMEKVVLFDNWGPAHGGTNRESHDFVLNRILEFGFPLGRVEFHDGHSLETVPQYFGSCDTDFDVIVIDDDHSEQFLGPHLADVMDRANFIVCHDMCLPLLVAEVYRRYIAIGQNYVLMFDNATQSQHAIFVRRSLI